MRTGGVILAAGLSSRMGCFKPLVDINGKPMIFWTIDSLLQAGVEQVVVVVGYQREELMKRISEVYGERVQFACNEQYENSEMFTSVVTGIKALHDIDAFYMLPGDMPAVSQLTFGILYGVMEASGMEIILPTVAGYRKHPPLIAVSMIEEILQYQGEQGLRGFWRQEAARILEVPVEDRGCELDADTPEALDNLREYLVLSSLA